MIFYIASIVFQSILNYMITKMFIIIGIAFKGFRDVYYIGRVYILYLLSLYNVNYRKSHAKSPFIKGFYLFTLIYLMLHFGSFHTQIRPFFF